jgi:hypothetical protein
VTGTCRRRRLLVTMGTISAIALACFFWWWSEPPQMGADKEVVKAVDALFTAVTAHDDKLLADCEQRLLALKLAGKLRPGASAYLDNLIAKAHAGHWQSVAHALYDFMRAQRREDLDELPDETGKQELKWAVPRGRN